MEAAQTQSAPTSTTAAPPPTSSQSQKLKDSCDNCSSSKVRCTKEKPSCARCEKSGYACFYSPARRVGRPYRPKMPSPAEKDGEEPERPHSTKAIRTTQVVDEGERPSSLFKKLSSQVDADRNSSIVNLRPSEHDPSFKTQQPTGTVAETHRHKVGQDCVLVVMDLFCELEVQTEQLRSSSLVDYRLANSTAQTIVAALRRLFTILICPCSERAELGMLVYAICMTIIDMHAMTLTKSVRNNPPPPVLVQTGLWHDHGASAQEPPENEAVAMLILGKLSKMAKLILQFIERYSGHLGAKPPLQEDHEIPSDILPILGSLMRERLQQTIDDATYWLG
ncbi:uncharacterized protein N7500_010434 [Penicillium coprophilum]|uniref:uncharacterized protein n=1 Tax=Penicillium coprophilum TaxID=36646 RepID=UPI00238F24CB|nr:uncharacterized protein N7500_010434 [Penicillium coprophilum]KAJ5154995.1 hypothetical protein N7500_010434 [Penicillium coprophilum]